MRSCAIASAQCLEDGVWDRGVPSHQHRGLPRHCGGGSCAWCTVPVVHVVVRRCIEEIVPDADGRCRGLHGWVSGMRCVACTGLGAGARGGRLRVHDAAWHGPRRRLAQHQHGVAQGSPRTRHATPPGGTRGQQRVARGSRRPPQATAGHRGRGTDGQHDWGRPESMGAGDIGAAPLRRTAGCGSTSRGRSPR